MKKMLELFDDGTRKDVFCIEAHKHACKQYKIKIRNWEKYEDMDGCEFIKNQNDPFGDGFVIGKSGIKYPCCYISTINNTAYNAIKRLRK